MQHQRLPLRISLPCMTVGRSCTNPDSSSVR
jgi:hypothetical protein